MVETITIRPEPLRPYSRPSSTAILARTPDKTAESAVSSGAYLRDQYDFQNRLKQHYMVKKDGSAADLRFPAAPNSPASAAQTANAAAESEVGFYDFLDIINPLQHIPGVSTIYRELTGDTIKPEFKLAGGGLFGGLVGIATSAIDAIIEEETGKDIGENLLAMFDGDDAESGQGQFAQNADASNNAAKLQLGSSVPDSHSSLAAIALPPALPSAVTLPVPGAVDKTARDDEQGSQKQRLDRDLLSVFGASSASAHASYQKADMLDYFEDVTFSKQL